MAEGDYLNFLALWLSELVKCGQEDQSDSKTQIGQVQKPSFLIEDILKGERSCQKVEPQKPSSEVNVSSLLQIMGANSGPLIPNGNEAAIACHQSHTSADYLTAVGGLTSLPLVPPTCNSSLVEQMPLLGPCSVKRTKRKARTAFTPFQLS